MKEAFDPCEEDVVNFVKAAANKLTKVGAIVEEMSILLHADCEINIPTSVVLIVQLSMI